MSTDLPGIPDAVQPDLRRALVRMREELQRLVGTRGTDPALRQGSATAAGGGALVVLPGTGSGGGSYTPDLTPPPAPTFGDGDALGGISQVIITWSGIGYTQGNGNKQTVVYAVQKDPSDPTMPTFPGDAGIVAVAPHALTVLAIPSEPNIRWHFWLKFQTNDGVLSTTPAGGTNGVQATTGQDVQHLMDVLTGAIREQHLWRALMDPIRSIIRRADEAADGAIGALVAAHQVARRSKSGLLAEASARGTSITQLRTLVNTGDAQLASQITTLTAAVDAAEAAIEDEVTARADGDDAEATARQLLATQMRGAYTGTDLALVSSGLLYDERQARSTADGAQVTRIEGLESSVDTPGTGLLARATVLESRTTDATSGNTALAARTSSLESTVNNPTTGVSATAAALDTVRTTVNNPTTGVVALATRTSTLEARVTTPSTDPGNPAYNVAYAAVQAEATTRAAETGDLYAQYTVKVDVNGYVAGYGLANTLNNATPFSEFAIRADRFYVAPTINFTQESAPATPSLNQRWFKPSTKEVKRWNGSAWVAFNNLQLVVQSAPTVEGGVTLPAGVYIDAAYIINLTATYARIASLVADQITAASINVSQLVAGSMAVGAYAQSTGFVSGSSGWRISGNGAAEFSGVVARGTIIATAGSIGGNAIDSTGMQSPGYSAGSTGWRLDTTGLIRAFASAGARVLDMAASGTSPVLKVGSALEVLANGSATFAGALAAATGSFAGSLTAATGTLGTLTIASGGNIKAGQTAYNTGTGFYLGIDSGTPKFSIGNPSGAHMRWDGTDLFINTPRFESFTASVPSGDISVSVASGSANYGSRTAIASGGTAPYAYTWVLSGPATTAAYITGGTSDTVGVTGSASGATLTGTVTCIVKDANGRTTFASFNFTATHAGTPPGG